MSEYLCTTLETATHPLTVQRMLQYALFHLTKFFHVHVTSVQLHKCEKNLETLHSLEISVFCLATPYIPAGSKPSSYAHC